MKFKWLNWFIQGMYDGKPDNRWDAAFGVLMFVVVSAAILLVGLMILSFTLNHPVFAIFLAIVVGLVYFLSTKVDLDGDGGDK